MKTIKLFILFTILLYSFSCKKRNKVNCSNAQLCVQNKSGTVVHFDWNGGAGQYNDSIMPNASACKNVGEVVISRTSTVTPTTYFYSDRGNYAITVKECNQTNVIN